MDWSSEQDEILIDFVRNHEVIYNVKCKNYTKALLKQSAWREIGRILNKTDVECSKRWAYIRDYYIRRRGRPCPGSSGEAVRRRCELLSFLDTCSSTRRSTVTDVSGINDNDISTEEFDTNETVTPEYVAVDMEYKSNSIQNVKDDVKIKVEDERRKSCENRTQNVYNFRQSQKRKASEERLKQRAKRQRSSTPVGSNETELFFTSMAQIVKKLPEYERAQLRLQIGTLVGNAELAYLSRQRDNSRPTSAATSSSYDDITDALSPASESIHTDTILP